MKLVVGGSISIVLGILGLVVFFSDLLTIIEGVLPVILIAGGVLVIYINRQDDGESLEESENMNFAKPEPAPAQTPAAEPSVVEPQTVEPVDVAATPVSATEPEPVSQTSDDQAAGPETGYVGNESSFVFHTPECKYAASKMCTMRFGNREDAIEKGYKPCRLCKP